MTTDNSKEELDNIFPCDCAFTKGFGFKKGDPCDGTCVLAAYRKSVEKLIQKEKLKAQIEAAQYITLNCKEREYSLKGLGYIEVIGHNKAVKYLFSLQKQLNELDKG